ncbi:Mitochondrial GTPase [Balamuthia mandrillaris]
MPHLLLLHKADLADPSFEAEIVDHFAKYKNKQALFTSSVLSTKSNNINNNLANIIPAAIDLYLRSKQQKQSSSASSSSASSSSASSSAGSTPSSPSSPPLPPQKKELMLMIVGVPNVGKSTLINKLRAVNNLRTASAKTGPLPGVTRGLNCFKVSERPVAAYLMDTPGIMMPRINDVEVGLKLSLVGAIKESVVGKKAIADYLLYSMNRLGNRSYLHTKTLLSRPSSQQQAQPQQKDEQQKDEQEDEPTDDINAVLLSIARRIGAKKKKKKEDNNQEAKSEEKDEERWDLDLAAGHFLQKYREGAFGRMTLDTMPLPPASPFAVMNVRSSKNKQQQKKK